jgi:hypothetical protein
MILIAAAPDMAIFKVIIDILSGMYINTKIYLRVVVYSEFSTTPKCIGGIRS